MPRWSIVSGTHVKYDRGIPGIKAGANDFIVVHAPKDVERFDQALTRLSMVVNLSLPHKMIEFQEMFEGLQRLVHKYREKGVSWSDRGERGR